MTAPVPAFTTTDADRLLGLADQFIADWHETARESGDAGQVDEWTERDAEWDAIRPLLMQAPALLSALYHALGAMDLMRDQIGQMRGLFPDEDGTIQAACDAHQDAKDDAAAVLSQLAGSKSAPGAEHLRLDVPDGPT